MPLLTENIFEARAAYSALELRVQSTEQMNSALQATVDNLRSKQTVVVDRAKLLTQYAVDQVHANAQLTAQQAGQVSPDVALDALIASLGLAVALAEASMPDRAVNSVTATVQTYLTFNTGPDGVSKVAGVRLYQPELGQPAALATASFEIAKVAPPPGAPAPRNLYAVLQDKQSLFANAFWTRFVAGAPPSTPASQIVAEIAKVFANIDGWTLPFLAQEAAAIAGLETTLSGLIAGTAPSPQVSAYATVVGALTGLAKSLDPASRSNYVAGDLYALAAGLDATTKIAAILLP